MDRTLWRHPDNPRAVQIIDQRRLPHELVVVDLHTSADAAAAIRDMAVRGAPLIAATAAYGFWLACQEAAGQNDPERFLQTAVAQLRESRPTAVNLFHALDRLETTVSAAVHWAEKTALALRTAEEMVEEDVDICYRIGLHGLEMFQKLYASKGGGTLHILTHCNAGRLACIEWGTATAPIYLAHRQGMDIHVWVDETRPRNQGANLTAWELQQAGIPHTVIVDNAGGHLMQHGMVDAVIVGTDRTTRTGDVANKIGTYLKALAAHDNGIPFYVALPSTTLDWSIGDGLRQIPIEERSPDEVRYAEGWHDGRRARVLLTPEGSGALNPAFDVTPARLVTALITERGVCPASESGLLALFPEKAWVSSRG